jgi:hypothetical protein
MASFTNSLKLSSIKADKLPEEHTMSGVQSIPNNKQYSWTTAAIQIIGDKCPNGSPETAEKYTDRLKAANPGRPHPGAADIRWFRIWHYLFADQIIFNGPEPLCKQPETQTEKPETKKSEAPPPTIEPVKPVESAAVSVLELAPEPTAPPPKPAAAPVKNNDQPSAKNKPSTQEESQADTIELETEPRKLTPQRIAGLNNTIGQAEAAMQRLQGKEHEKLTGEMRDAINGLNMAIANDSEEGVKKHAGKLVGLLAQARAKAQNPEKKDDQ